VATSLNSNEISESVGPVVADGQRQWPQRQQLHELSRKHIKRCSRIDDVGSEHFGKRYQLRDANLSADQRGKQYVLELILKESRGRGARRRAALYRVTIKLVLYITPLIMLVVAPHTYISTCWNIAVNTIAQRTQKHGGLC